MNCEVALPEQTYSKLKWSGPATEAVKLVIKNSAYCVDSKVAVDSCMCPKISNVIFIRFVSPILIC